MVWKLVTADSISIDSVLRENHSGMETGFSVSALVVNYSVA